MSGLNKTYYSVTVKETDTSRGSIRKIGWVDVTHVREADVILLPWHALESMEEPIFPSGTTDLFRFLQSAGLGTVSLPVDQTVYQELVMHGKAWRLPTILLSTVALPVFLNVISTQLSNMLPGVRPSDTIHLEVIVERPTSPCLSIKYEGPADRLPQTLLKESEACLEKAEKAPAPTERPKTI